MEIFRWLSFDLVWLSLDQIWTFVDECECKPVFDVSETKRLTRKKIPSTHEELNRRSSGFRALSHRDSTVSEVYYEVHMTRVLHTATNFTVRFSPNCVHHLTRLESFYTKSHHRVICIKSLVH